MAETAGLSREELRSATEREWYHTIELAPGIVTPGWFDTRKIVQELPLPASLEGKRCLDIATFDGFWAFEMERRGADEVVAIDILDPEAWDWPVNSPREMVEAMERRKEGGRGFEVASAALGSAVTYLECSVYDLDPAEHGEFDFVYLGSLLMHLRDPVGALERVRSVCRGQLLVVDNVNLLLSLLFRRTPAGLLYGMGRPWWWNVNFAGLVRLVEIGGFRLVQPAERIYMPAGPGHPFPRWDRQLLVNSEARHFMLTRLKGDPHAAILVEPVRDPG
jgi:tRNA (mo5U34)-methyltransferase